jgi:large subunit ribosomal protein LP0
MKASLTALNTAPTAKEDDFESRGGANWAKNDNVDKILAQLKGNINIIFTNGDLAQVKKVLDEEVRPSPAKPGMIAPDDVSIPAGPTGLDPKLTSFFQNLQIQTKIVKGQVEIVAAKQVIFAAEKVTSTQAQLLEKLKIYPFSYKMEVSKVLQDGSLFDAKVLDLSAASILAKFKNAAGVQASLSLGAGFPTSASAPHSLLNGFKNLVAASAASGFEFAQATALLEAAKNAPAAGAAAATGAAQAAPVEEEKKEEVEAVDMGGLFGGDDDEY